MKTIYLIRHGESTFNVAYDNKVDPYLFDARLTQVGENQASQLSEHVMEHLKDVELVITSPLTRALETTKRSLSKLLESNSNIKCIVSPLHREVLMTSDDNGRERSIIEKEYPEFDFQSLEERWWIPEFCPELKSDLSIDTHKVFMKTPFRESESLFLERIRQFKQLLLSRPESNIAVVGHGDFFYYLLDEKMEDIPNCKIIKWLIDSTVEPSYLNF
ncbi:hypothetical protein DICPUDRAFT_31945 [Dictyostelium purpureum]|uniref:Phosphoglycerate mutase family protein n=1 Tax=Dictyostelium purpureum TaxID=5786 RepID=F0ZI52_DICPU|nr:uncharacterized protein DICPUDRAFT_31945 [Dictyostelium purpureum]EGC36400.1 hypothetical protein DICPUDRAFT_31945 [Dictyostelium purpureum]|eukprot:XP_003287097.1 hypothetical protein DICPUDRAFT_31945 [Dictyostelium purpureum]